MKDNNLLLAIAVIAVVVSVLAAGITYFSVASLFTRITGFVSTGDANLTVETLAQINFTNTSVNWGSGIVDGGQTRAYLDSTTGTVVNGNWTAFTGGLIIENIGNTNVSLNLSVTGNATDFIGGSSPVYQWNVSAVEALSCLNATSLAASEMLDQFFDVNATTVNFCERFQHINAADSVEITFNLTIPDDSKTGVLSDTLTALVWAV